MKNLFKLHAILAICFLNYNTFSQNTNPTQHPTFLKKDSTKSALDGNIQVFYYHKASDSKPKPLVVQLHSWSNAVENLTTIQVDSAAKAKDWHYIFPNFRGVNNHAKACCSEFALTDIDEAIDWALKHLNVDKKRIYLVGHSGGGYATLAMYMKSKHNIKAFSAWVPISDLAAWYGESVERKNKYAAEIIKCTGGNDIFDVEKAKGRSPLFWKTPVKKRKKSALKIYAGVHDGYTGSVPISQSINFYNKLLTDTDERNKSKFVSVEEAQILLKTQSFPLSENPKLLGNRVILYQKSTKNIQLTIFEGSHELLNKVVLETLK